MSSGCCQDCNDSPPCPAPGLEFVSSMSSGVPCGLALPSHPDNTALENCTRYAVKTSVYHTVYDQDGTTFVDSVEVPIHEDGENTRTHTLTAAMAGGSCESTYTTTDVDRQYALTTLLDDRKWPEFTLNSSSSSSSSSSCAGTATSVTTYESDPPDPGDTETVPSTDVVCYAAEQFPDTTWTKTGLVYTKVEEIGPEAGYTGFYTLTRTVTYSLPVTVPPLALPSYPAYLSGSSAALTAGQGRATTAEFLNSCPAIQHQKIKYRVRHLPTGTCYLKVWISKVFTPTGGAADSPVVTSYEWTGPGNPCLTVALDPVDADSQKINGTETEVGVPASLGITSVTIQKWSCVPGYEPDISDSENPQPNGFPDPTWEASPP